MHPFKSFLSRNAHFALFSALVVLLSACASMIGNREVTVPLTKLQSKLDEKFPLERNFPPFFELSLKHPQLNLCPDQNRILANFQTTITLLLSGKTILGQVEISGTPVFDAQRNALILSNPAIDQLTFDQATPTQNQQLTLLGKTIVGALVDDPVLYTFKQGTLEFAGTRFVPSDIRILPEGIRVMLTPAKP